LWQARFGGDESVIGSTVGLDLVPYTVIGVMPKYFRFPAEGVPGLAQSECWVPAGFSPAEMATPGFDLIVFGRLKPGVTLAQASEDTSAATRRVLESYPVEVQKTVALVSRLVPLQQQVTATSRPAIVVFASAVALLLLIGCGNVANLMLARLQSRGREMAIRTALGASRTGLARQLLVECTVLAGSGGVLGIAVAVVLLRVFVAVSPEKLTSVPPGFDPNHVLTFSVALPADGYPQPRDVERFATALGSALDRLPSVRYTASGSSLPLDTTGYTVISRPNAPPAFAGFKPAALYTISPGYLPALGIVLKRGRSLEPSDTELSLPVALVNEAMARQYWSGTDVVGRQIQWAGGGPHNLTVVGVVADVHQDRLDSPILPALYIPLSQSPQPIRDLIFVVRTAGPPLRIAGTVRQAAATVDPALPIFALQAAEDRLAHSVAPRRFNMLLLALFAACAFALAAFGLYAVTTHLVGQCSREFGIRIALGATTSRILGTVMARGLVLAAVGLVIGTGLSIGLTRFMTSLLFGIEATDQTTFLLVATLLLVTSILAVVPPALRASRVDPVVSLRYE
jgi:putative ABC transport system permease protein